MKAWKQNCIDDKEKWPYMENQSYTYTWTHYKVFMEK